MKRPTPLCLCLGLGLSLAPVVAQAFGEEPVGGGTTNSQPSTHHLQWTRALAACAGLPYSSAADPFGAPALAETIALFDELTDEGRLQGSSTCTAGAYALPTAAALGCAAPSLARVYPAAGWAAASGCFTSRYGPYASLFHFATEEGLAALRSWALDPSATLSAQARFAFGVAGEDVYSASCYRLREEVVDTGSVTAGTPQAFGLYLHALADRYSHQVCVEHWGARTAPPWPMHTRGDVPQGCDHSNHSYEFGCPSPEHVPFVQHNVDASEAVFGELLRYAQSHGYAPRVASFDASGAWLRRQAQRFAVDFDSAHAEQRAAFAQAVLERCATASPSQRCLPEPAGVAPACATFPLTPQCAGEDAQSAADATSDAREAPSAEPAPAATPRSGTTAPCTAAPPRSAPSLLPFLLFALALYRAGRRSA